VVVVVTSREDAQILNKTNRHPFDGLFFRTSWITRHQEVETILDFNEARDDGVAVTSAGPYVNDLHLSTDIQPCQNLITQFLQAGCYSWCPTNAVKGHWRHRSWTSRVGRSRWQSTDQSSSGMLLLNGVSVVSVAEVVMCRCCSQGVGWNNSGGSTSEDGGGGTWGTTEGTESPAEITQTAQWGQRRIAIDIELLSA